MTFNGPHASRSTAGTPVRATASQPHADLDQKPIQRDWPQFSRRAACSSIATNALLGRFGIRVVIRSRHLAARLRIGSVKDGKVTTFIPDPP